MEFTGLLGKYPANRPLTEQERLHHLKQKQRLNVEPKCQLSVIKMNSTFMELVDKWYGWKGALSTVTLLVIGGFVALYVGLLYVALTRATPPHGGNDDTFVLVAAACMIFPLVALASWLLCKESFAYTHYPMRFNRKTRMVHVFRTNGTVLSVPWDEIFFTLGRLPQWDEWEVRGHVLASDSVTVRETFPLSYVGSIAAADIQHDVGKSSVHDFVRAHWEFVRRYMEDGPEAVSRGIQFCMPVDGRHENGRVGMERIFANVANGPFLAYWIFFPLCLTVSFFRQFAMRTSKIPRWPDEINATCGIDAGDPYAIIGTADGARASVFPAVAGALGVGLRAQPSDIRKPGGKPVRARFAMAKPVKTQPKSPGKTH
jgi:hypothetical protein